MVGERYVLHVQGDRLEVAFVEFGRVTQCRRASPIPTWAGQVAAHEERGPMLSYRSGAWRSERPMRNRLAVLGNLHGHGRSCGRRLGVRQLQRSACLRSSNLPRPRQRSSGTTARPGLSNESLLRGRPDGTISRRVPGARRPVGGLSAGIHPRRRARTDAGALGRARAAVDGRARERDRAIRTRTSCAACPMAPPGRSASLRPAARPAPEILVLRFTTTWERDAGAVDSSRASRSAGRLAPVSGDEVWLSASCGNLDADCCERFLHYRRRHAGTTDGASADARRTLHVGLDQGHAVRFPR